MTSRSKAVYSGLYRGHTVVPSYPEGPPCVVMIVTVGGDAPDNQMGREVRVPLNRRRLEAMLKQLDVEEETGDDG